MIPTIKHNGGEIHYDEVTNRWLAYVNNSKVSERQSLKDAKRAIDDLDRKAKEFTRHKVYLNLSSWGNPTSVIEAEATSYSDDGEVWIKVTAEDARGTHAAIGRQKVCVSRLFAHTPENLELVKVLAERANQLRLFEAETSRIAGTMQKYTLRLADGTAKA